MESFAFELKLVDSVSAAAKKAETATRAFKEQAEKAKKALNFHEELEKAEHQLKRLKIDPAGFQKLVRAQKELAEQRKKLGKEGLIDVFKEKFSFGRMTAAAALGDLLSESLIEGAHKVVEIISEGVKFAFEAGSKGETSRLAYKLTLGKEGGAAAQEDIARFSGLTGLSGSQIEPMILQQRRAGFDQKTSRTNLAMALDAAAGMGKGGDEGTIGGILEGFTNIKRRGGITKKQLVGIGVSDQSMPDFYKELGKSLKVSAKEAEKLAEEGGKVDPQLILNIIGNAIEKQQGGKLGTGAAEYGRTMEARINKLKSLPEEFFRKMSESPSWPKLANKFGEVLERLSPESENGRRIIDKLMGTFGNLADSIVESLTPENIDAFASGIETAVHTAGELLVIFKDIAETMLSVVKYIGKMIDGYKELKGDLSYAAKGGEAAAGSKTATTGQVMGGRLDVLNGMLKPDQEQIDFKKKELRMGTFSPEERKQREAEIERLQRAAGSPQAAVAAPAVARQGGKVIHLNVAPGAVVVQPREGESTEEAARRAGKAVVSAMSSAIENETLMSGG